MRWLVHAFVIGSIVKTAPNGAPLGAASGGTTHTPFFYLLFVQVWSIRKHVSHFFLMAACTGKQIPAFMHTVDFRFLEIRECEEVLIEGIAAHSANISHQALPTSVDGEH